ncbi:MAG: hypothetical protein ACYCXW_01315 [Solirubrobacteraceae bacterium]
MEFNDARNGFDQVLALAPSCTLSMDGRRSQRERYLAIAASVDEVAREDKLVWVKINATVDPSIVDEVISVERECCPWLRFEFDRIDLRLKMTTADPDMLPALDAIEDAFTGAIR